MEGNRKGGSGGQERQASAAADLLPPSELGAPELMLPPDLVMGAIAAGFCLRGAQPSSVLGALKRPLGLAPSARLPDLLAALCGVLRKTWGRQCLQKRASRCRQLARRLSSSSALCLRSAPCAVNRSAQRFKVSGGVRRRAGCLSAPPKRLIAGKITAPHARSPLFCPSDLVLLLQPELHWDLANVHRDATKQMPCSCPVNQPS